MVGFALFTLFAVVTVISLATVADAAVRARGAFLALRGELEQEKKMIRYPQPLPRSRRIIAADRRLRAGEPLAVLPRAAA